MSLLEARERMRLRNKFVGEPLVRLPNEKLRIVYHLGLEPDVFIGMDELIEFVMEVERTP